MSNNICLYYLPFSGGKFIANCLALSRHVVCNDPELATADMAHTELDSEYYKFKLRAVTSSLDMDFIQGRQWREFGDFNDYLYPAVVANNKYVVRLAHFNDNLEQYRAKFPDIKTCKLINFNKFNELSYVLKSANPSNRGHLTALGHGFWINDSLAADITFDVDNSIASLSVFLAEIKKLYEYFGLDDFSSDLLTAFYTRYLLCHNLPTNP